MAAPFSGAEAHAVQKAVARACSGDWSSFSALAGGEPVRALEAAWAQRVGVGFALALSSGTLALEVALRACDIGPGDEVVLSPYDWGAAAGAVLRVGAIPVFGDIDPLTYTLDPESVRTCLTPRSKALVVTHLFGHPAAMAPLLEIARRHGLVVIEDCAQALGARYQGRSVGTFGAFGCFSLGQGKLVSGGEGGILVTDDERLFEQALFWSQHPLRQLADGGQVGSLGNLALNGRIHPLAAEIASVQLTTLERRLEVRRAKCELFSKGLAGIPGLRPVFVAPGCESTYHRYSPTFVPEEVEGVSRELYVAALAAEGVPIHLGFLREPLHLHSVFQLRSYGRDGWPWEWVGSSRCYRAGDCPVAEARCASFELGLDVDWGGEQPAWITQVLEAFTKVAENLERLRSF
jgi:dTDP-4-amino-4,6-dideoxygalactose transaminase